MTTISDLKPRPSAQRRASAALPRVETALRSRSTQQCMKDWFSGRVREMSLAVEVGCTPEIRSRLP
ncbi:hypothetical protein ACVWXO_003635 [Bradyrhizobium sp. LM2.7]